MKTWHVLATDRMGEQVVLRSYEAEFEGVKKYACDLSVVCPAATIVVRDYDEVDLLAFEGGKEVEL